MGRHDALGKFRNLFKRSKDTRPATPAVAVATKDATIATNSTSKHTASVTDLEDDSLEKKLISHPKTEPSHVNQKSDANGRLKEPKSASEKQLAIGKHEGSDEDGDLVQTSLGSAFEEALFSLDEKQQAQLNDYKGMTKLFQELDEADAKHMENSWFRKGLKAATPYLSGARFLINTASPFVSISPPAATALGLAQGVISVSPSRQIIC